MIDWYIDKRSINIFLVIFPEFAYIIHGKRCNAENIHEHNYMINNGRYGPVGSHVCVPTDHTVSESQGRQLDNQQYLPFHEIRGTNYFAIYCLFCKIIDCERWKRIIFSFSQKRCRWMIIQDHSDMSLHRNGEFEHNIYRVISLWPWIAATCGCYLHRSVHSCHSCWSLPSVGLY
jgi:hypothetical protein